jgi:disulfide bond formation protein DsbB
LALFWSNLAFLLVGVFILLIVWRLGKDHKRFYVLGISTILVGIFSSVYHFMHNANYLVWDMVGIAVLMSTFAYFTLSRLIKFKIAW